MTRHERAVGHRRPSRQPEAIFKEKNYEYKGFITALLRKDYRVNSLQLQYLAHAAALVNNGSKTGDRVALSYMLGFLRSLLKRAWFLNFLVKKAF